jgi:hypothetical protein
MIGMMSGSTVRDMDGTTGRIIAWQLPEVKIGWDDGKMLPREENIASTNPRLKSQIQVLTLDAGWRPLGEFTGFSGAPNTPSTQSTIAQLRTLMSEADAMPDRRAPLLEGPHYPYANKKKLGPGPRGGTNAEVPEWKCKCSNYSCQCTGKEGRKKTVKIDKGYKKAYNKEYKAWRKKQG